MCPAEPRPDAEAEEGEGDESLEGEAPPADALDLDGLRRRGDVPGLLELAKAYRSGTAPGGRDFKKCLETYRAAAELGSAEAEYAVALFHINGGTVVSQDLKEGAMHLRAAAEKGSVPAKVYLGNLYELGIHYKADPEKADVWYRNAARTARVSASQGTPEWTRALADLGCARQVLELTSDAEIDADEKARLLARARAHGHGLKIRDEALELERVDRATLADSLAAAEPSATAPTGTPPPVSVDLAPREPRDRKDTTPESRQARKKLEERSQARTEKKTDPKRKRKGVPSAQVALGLGAFGYALLFVLAGAGAGYAATLGARELTAHGQTLPVLGTHTRYVFPIVLALVGVLPAWLVYKLGAVLKAVAIGAALGGVGWVAWGTGQGALHADRALQALAFGLAGFLAGLLVLGLLGGAKSPR